MKKAPDLTHAIIFKEEIVMKKTPFVSLFILLSLILSLAMPIAAADISTEPASTDAPIQLAFENFTTEESSDGGIVAYFDLVTEAPPSETGEVSPAGIGWVEVVGWGQVKCRLLDGNGIGIFDWQFHLDNGDVFKAVYGVFVIERNSFLLPNFNIGKEEVNETYGPGPLYNSAYGSESFRIEDELDPDLNVLFKWSNFKVTWVRGSYSLPAGRIAGTVNDFK